VLCASSKVAALFKIGNSRELPPIPDHLSEDGKNFVRLCLQRNPSHRPSAEQLLEHPFVKNAAPLERPILSADPSDAPPVVTNAVRSLVQAILFFSFLFLISHDQYIFDAITFQKKYIFDAMAAYM
jgi:serine/threonine protein kinase